MINNIYDFVVIGAGISGCTFASCLNKRFSGASILLVEHGRRIGGRATTRKSRRNKILEFDHGLPSINLSKHISQDIQTLILPLIKSKKLVDISKEILVINEFGFLNKASINYNIYRSLPFMMNFCEEIIHQSYNPKKINFLFETLIKSIKHVNNSWEIEANNGIFFKSRNLILSSSLLAHSRCLEILNTTYLPLRDSMILGKDDVVDSVLRETSKLSYIKRKIYILYVSNLEVVNNFNYIYLQILFENVIKDDLNFERIIFQGQSDGSMIIVLHCSYTGTLIDINSDNIIKCLLSLFQNYIKFLDLFLEAKIIDTMKWRASQPLNHLLPKELQWSANSNIGFCGDWFDMDCLGGIESAINSSIRLAKLLSWK